MINSLKNLHFYKFPNSIKFSLLKQKDKQIVFMYSNNFYYSFLLNTNQIYYNQTTHIFTYKSTTYNEFEKLFEYTNNLFLYSLEFYFLQKIKFAGKSFRVEKQAFIKNSKDIYFYKFGHSFKTFVFLKNTKQKHLKKIKFFFLTTNLLNLKKKLITIKNLRNWNIYTQRGIRLGKQKILKKPGKKSSFT